VTSSKKKTIKRDMRATLMFTDTAHLGGHRLTEC
jgi:hypothetical protein